MAAQSSLAVFTRTLGVCVGVVLLTANVPAGAETVTNPRYASWSGFEAGAQVTREERTELSGTDALLAPDGVALKVVTYRLVESTPTQVVVEIRVIEHDFLSTIELAPTRVTFPAKVERAHLEAVQQVAGLKVGEEACDVLGKSMTCKTLTGRLDRGDTETEYATWVHAKVPGGIVKQVRTSTDPQGSVKTTVELKSYKGS